MIDRFRHRLSPPSVSRIGTLRPCVAARPRVATLLATLAVLCLAGCVTRQSGDPVRLVGAPSPSPIGTSDWPARLSAWDDGEQDLEDVVAPGEIYLEAIVPPPYTFPEPREPMGWYGQGTLERIDLDEVSRDSERLQDSRDRLGLTEWLVFESRTSTMRPAQTIGRRTELPRPLPNWLRLVERSATSLVIFEPEGPPRGMIIHLASLAGYADYELEMVEEFRDRGWLVLSTAIPSPRLYDEELDVDLDDGAAMIGLLLGQSFDERVAEWAYGIEATLEYLDRRFPRLREEPVVGIGSSAGALALPAVAGRLSRRLDAAVLIGGGANVLEIVRRTTLLTPPVRLNWKDGREPDAATWEAIDDAYLRSSRLDPLHAVRFLRDRPLLMMHASWDGIVPAACGDALWELAGRPERWTYAAGHLGLFFFWLPNEKTAVADWVESAVAERAIPATLSSP